MPTPNDFSDYRCTGDMSTDRKEGTMGKGGEYQAQEWTGAPATPPVPENTYPNVFNYGQDPSNPQFSSKMSGDPIELMDSTRAQVQAHADLLAAYGLMMPEALPGTHPYLRDSLATPGESEPGNAEPVANEKLPKRKGV